MNSLMIRGIALTVAFISALAVSLVGEFTLTEVCAFAAFIIAVDSWVQLQITNAVIIGMFNYLKNKDGKDARKTE